MKWLKQNPAQEFNLNFFNRVQINNIATCKSELMTENIKIGWLKLNIKACFVKIYELSFVYLIYMETSATYLPVNDGGLDFFIRRGDINPYR